MSLGSASSKESWNSYSDLICDKLQRDMGRSLYDQQAIMMQQLAYGYATTSAAPNFYGNKLACSDMATACAASASPKRSLVILLCQQNPN